jgi:uncharacterized membrane protein (UPF0182 family)
MTGKRSSRLVAVALIVVASAGGSAFTLYTDFLFFSDIGYTPVFIKTIAARVIVGFVLGLSALVFVVGNVLIANRMTFCPLSPAFASGAGIPSLPNMNKKVKLLSLTAALVIALLGGFWGNSLWKSALVFMNKINIGLPDPIFGADIAFYLFELPFFRSLQGFAFFVIVVAFLVVGTNYFFRGAMVPSGNSIAIDSRARKHLAVLGGLFILNMAAGFYLSRFDLLRTPHSVLYGAAYTDVNVKLIALGVLCVLAVIAALSFSLGFWKGRLKLALVPAAVTAASYVVGMILLPVLLQSLRVAPNELDLEKPFIENHIKFTRFGYDLERIDVRPFDPGHTLTSEQIEKNDATIRNIRLWDDAPLLKTFGQLQQIRTYYKFTDVDNDRYTIDGEYRQVMLAPRELSYADLPSRSWINEKLVFTHGNGVAVGPVNRITREGLPEFIIKDIPPVSSAGIKVTRPEIYFGELSSDYVVVGTKQKEFSYPTSEGNTYTSYTGNKGVLLDSLLKKVAFAVRFNSAKIVLSSDITSTSRILFKREIKDRVRTVAPFLSYDEDPYVVIADDGRLFWIIDAYTVSNDVPYSKPVGRSVNYIRNSVKAIVDAYDGTVDFYISDPNDVIIKVYDAVFPGLFKPLADMPDDLKRHIRYPQELFRIQASMLAVYHMTDPKTFYNREDLWEIPTHEEKPMQPYYTVMKMPEAGGAKDEKEEYMLLLPFTPSKRDNLSAWLAARCDWPNYGSLVAYAFPRDRLVFGPRQVSARIDQDSHISQQLTLWGQKGSRVLRGRLLVIPIENSLLYVQPLYLVASAEGGLPELRRVIVAYENDVVMEESLEAGLTRLFGQRRGLLTRDVPTEKVEAALSVSQLAKEAVKVFERASELQRQGDWAGYGEHQKKLAEVLRRLAK